MIREDRATAEARTYGRAAGLLTVAIGSAGLLTYAYFALASHTLSREEYGQIVVLWSAVFLAVSTLFRPIEQLLSRTLAELESHGGPTRPVLRTASLIQLGIAACFVAVALALRGPLENELLDGERTLYLILIAAVVAFAAAFFGRGFLAGRRQFPHYAALLLVEAVARVAFALVVAIGIAKGEVTVALGVAAAPLMGLAVLPFALRRRRAPERVAERSAAGAFTLGQGGGFAAAVLLIMLSEQVLLNSGPLIVQATLGTAAAGFIFNVLMVARAPLLLFQAVAASLLPHLTRLLSRDDEASDQAFHLSLRATLLAIVGFAALVFVGVVAIGPWAMQLAFGDRFSYDRLDLAIVAVGMGIYLSAATLNQAALAQGQARRAAACWIMSAVVFLAWNVLPWMDEFRRVETGFAASAAVLCGLLYVIYRRPRGRPEDVVVPDSPRELEVRLAAADEAAEGI